MKKLFWIVGCLALGLSFTGTVSAQEAGKKKVWTNDDFVSVRQAPKPVAVQEPLKVASVMEAKTPLELETRIQLKQRWMTDLKTMLEQSKEDIMHATNQDARAAAMTRVKLIEHDLEDGGAEIHQLEAKLAVLKGTVELN